MALKRPLQPEPSREGDIYKFTPCGEPVRLKPSDSELRKLNGRDRVL